MCLNDSRHRRELPKSCFQIAFVLLMEHNATEHKPKGKPTYTTELIPYHQLMPQFTAFTSKNSQIYCFLGRKPFANAETCSSVWFRVALVANANLLLISVLSIHSTSLRWMKVLGNPFFARQLLFQVQSTKRLFILDWSGVLGSCHPPFKPGGSQSSSHYSR